jgi:chromatin remodeling complex protein RSC6
MSASRVKKSVEPAAAAVAPVAAPVTTKKSKATPVPVAPVPVAVPVVATAPVTKKPRVTKEKVVVAKPVAEKETAPKVKAPVAPKVKVPATPENVTSELLSVIESLSKQHVCEVKDVKQALKLLRTTASSLKGVRDGLARVLKKTNRTKAPRDKTKLSNSGLMKPVSISKELAQFMGVPADSLHSRVSVTNAICNYIKSHNLQNPANKRQINADANLSKILGYNASSGQPLTYFYIQQLIQPHFLKEVSSDMSKFMGVSDKSMVSNSAVVSAVQSYAAKKGLVHDGSVQPDETLTKLLGKNSAFSVASLGQLVKSHFKK